MKNLIDIISSLAILIVVCSSSAFAQSGFTIPLLVADSGSQSETIRFGMHPDATYGIDGLLGEAGQSGPPTVVGIFDVRFIDLPDRTELDNGVELDLRPYISPAQIDTFHIKYKPGPTGFPMHLSWPSGLAELCDSLFLKDVINGQIVNVNMLTDTSAGIQQSFLDRLYIIMHGAKVTTVAEEGQGIPTQFNLLQNYPNPFNPSTNIRYDLPAQSVVSLKVFNLLGQEVASLISNEEIPQGQHAVEFNTLSALGGLASGTYFYRMEAVDAATGKRFTKINKMLLIK